MSQNYKDKEDIEFAHRGAPQVAETVNQPALEPRYVGVHAQTGQEKWYLSRVWKDKESGMKDVQAISKYASISPLKYLKADALTSYSPKLS